MTRQAAAPDAPDQSGRLGHPVLVLGRDRAHEYLPRLVELGHLVRVRHDARALPRVRIVHIRRELEHDGRGRAIRALRVLHERGVFPDAHAIRELADDLARALVHEHQLPAQVLRGWWLGDCRRGPSRSLLGMGRVRPLCAALGLPVELGILRQDVLEGLYRLRAVRIGPGWGRDGQTDEGGLQVRGGGAVAFGVVGMKGVGARAVRGDEQGYGAVGVDGELERGEAEDEDEGAVGLGEGGGERGSLVGAVWGEGDALEGEGARLAGGGGGEGDVGDVEEDECFGVGRHRAKIGRWGYEGRAGVGC